MPIAVINLIKFHLAGSKNSNTSDEKIKEALKDKLYITNLKSQILDLLPNIIICGHTYDYFGKIFPELKKQKYQVHNNNWYYFLELVGKKIIVIDYWHPCTHGGSKTADNNHKGDSKKMFDRLVEILNAIKVNCNYE